MNEAERVSQLIDEIYDAALGSAQSSQAVEKAPLSPNGQKADHGLAEAIHLRLNDKSLADLPRRDIDVLASHFRRAIAIGKLINLHKVEAATFADTLDGFAAGMFLVDGAALIVHANASGQAMLDRGVVVRERSGRLTAVDRRADQALHEAFAAAAAGATRRSAIPLGGSEDDCWAAHVLPLPSGARRQTGLPYAAVAAVFVRRAALNCCSLETIADLYGLTPAELRVLVAIVEIGGVPEVAPVLGVSETTVRSHLQHVFEKTGIKRQADLVKLVASQMSPIA
jgi:DNA-binding CsgD family transcriptional regulator